MPVSGAWTYTESGGNATITDYDTGVGGFTPTIPTTLDGYPVIAIAASAMSSKSLTSITIGHAVDLGSNCFSSNSGVAVTLSADCTSSVSWNVGPFEFCNIGSGLTISEGVTTLPQSIFASAGVTSVTFPSTLTTIEQYAFYLYTGSALTGELVMPTALVSIGFQAFRNQSITKLEFDHAITLANNAFVLCDSLTEIIIDANITVSSPIKTEGIFEVADLSSTTITITNNVTALPGGLFAEANITSIDIPATVVTIGDFCLYDNDNLDSIIIRSTTTVTFGTDVLDQSQPSPKGTIYGAHSSTESWAAGYSTYYNYDDVPTSQLYLTDLFNDVVSEVSYNSYVTLDSNLSDVPLMWGFSDKETFFDFMKDASVAYPAIINTDREDMIQVIDYDSTPADATPVDTWDEDDLIIEVSNPQIYNNNYAYLDVHLRKISVEESSEILRIDDVTIPVAGVSIDRARANAIVAMITSIGMTKIDDTIIDSYTYGPQDISIDLANQGASEETTTVVVKGRTLSIRKSDVIEYSHSIWSELYTRRLVVDNIYMQDTTYCNTYAENLLNLICNPNSSIIVEAYTNPAVEIGDIIRVNSETEDIINVDIRVLRHSITWDGTLKGTLLGRRID